MVEGKIFLNWSTGKDAAMSLYYLQKKGGKVDALFTTVNAYYNRVSMHGLHSEMLKKQAKATGIPLEILEIPKNPDMETYTNLMGKRLRKFAQQGYTKSAFGDIFLEDLKVYREKELEKYNLQGLFPLWGKDTKNLVKELLDLGFRCIVICASAKFFNKDFVGQELTQELVDNFPDSVDFCGENGEFHTFCFDGPVFKTPVSFRLGEKVYREYPNPSKEGEKIGFWYVDIKSESS